MVFRRWRQGLLANRTSFFLTTPLPFIPQKSLCSIQHQLSRYFHSSKRRHFTKHRFIYLIVRGEFTHWLRGFDFREGIVVLVYDYFFILHRIYLRKLILGGVSSEQRWLPVKVHLLGSLWSFFRGDSYYGKGRFNGWSFHLGRHIMIIRRVFSQ